MEKDPFKEYLRESEPDKAHKGYAWSTAIGLQAVDGLKPSKYSLNGSFSISTTSLHSYSNQNSLFRKQNDFRKHFMQSVLIKWKIFRNSKSYNTCIFLNIL